MAEARTQPAWYRRRGDLLGEWGLARGPVATPPGRPV